jgi:hypothetical protein
MDPDDREDAGVCKFLIPIGLVKELSEAMLDILNRWAEERDEDELDIHYCQVAMMAATSASVELLVMAGGAHPTIQ